MMNVGDRVAALMSSDSETVKLFGYGKYIGETVPKVEGDGTFASSLRDGNVPNPTIELDSGKIVYGCECWWGPEEKTKAMIGGRKIVEVDIDSYRKGVI